MATFNTVIATVRCPECTHIAEMQVNMYFGFRNQIEYKLGDEIEWVPRREPQNGGRPPNGDTEGEAWMECPNCGKDSNMLIAVRSDRIVDVKVDDSVATE